MTRTRASFSRRGLLRLSAAAFAAPLAPFVPLLQSRAAEAQPHPRRLLLFYMPIGVWLPHWRPEGGTHDFKLSRVLEPLQRHRKKLTILDGLDNVAATGGPGHGGHPGVSCVWTGRPHSVGIFSAGGAAGFGWPQGPSVDQFIAGEIAKTQPTAIDSMEVGFELHGGQEWVRRMSFRGPSQPVPIETDPVAVYDSLFGELGMDPQKLAALRAARASSIDVVMDELAATRTRLPAADRMKLDAHLEHLRTIEKKLERPVRECDARPKEPEDSSSVDKIMDAHTGLIASAFACGMTRVASVMGGKEQGGLDSPRFLGIKEGGHHLISHRRNPEGRELLTRITIWYAQRLAKLLDALDAVPEGAGTLLDNTVVVWASPMGAPAIHDFRGLPVVLAGSAGGHFKTGRYLKWGNYQGEAAKKNSDHGGRSFNDLLTSLCHAMEIPVASFGDPRFCAGPLTELTA